MTDTSAHSERKGGHFSQHPHFSEKGETVLPLSLPCSSMHRECLPHRAGMYCWDESFRPSLNNPYSFFVQENESRNACGSGTSFRPCLLLDLTPATQRQCSNSILHSFPFIFSIQTQLLLLGSGQAPGWAWDVPLYSCLMKQDRGLAMSQSPVHFIIKLFPQSNQSPTQNYHIHHFSPVWLLEYQFQK